VVTVVRIFARTITIRKQMIVIIRVTKIQLNGFFWNFTIICFTGKVVQDLSFSYIVIDPLSGIYGNLNISSGFTTPDLHHFEEH
jgi:hypothetical protein